MRLCLNMIVKDESAILERCLRSLLPHIDCFLICDTGSADETVEIIERVFQELPGEVHSIAFRDFGQARNQALVLARQSPLKFDYLLLIDADMELVITDSRWKEELFAPAYLVRQVAGGMAYQNVRVLARDAQARYVGATHEYLQLEQPAGRLTKVYMLDHACGASRADKLERDLALLTKSLEENPQDPRSVFYYAQTLREAGRYHQAIENYRRRIDLGGWDEEVWFAQFMIARCYQALEDVPNFTVACLEAYNLRSTRGEPLHALAVHYRHAGLYEAGALMAEAGLEMTLPADSLFVDEEIYRSGFRHELSISGFYSSLPHRRVLGRRFCRELSTDRAVPPTVRDLARSNWRHYVLDAVRLFGSARMVAIEHPVPAGYNPCNPTLAFYQGEIRCVLRTVNYWMEKDRYGVFEGGNIRTQNYLLRLDRELNVCSSVPVIEKQPARIEDAEIEGLEDVRLIVDGPVLRASATVADRTPDWRRQIVVFDLAENGEVGSLTIQEFGAEHHQKNWVPFVDDRGLGFIYWTDPTTVLRWSEEHRQAVPWLRRHCPVALEHLRGGSQALNFDDGWLYITHEVGYQGGERIYFHRFVSLDSTFRLRSLTEPFYFRHLGVEFCCGLVVGPGEGELLASFGVEDREAWLVVLKADEVRRKLRPISDSL